MLGTTEGFKLSIPNPVLKIADNIFRLTNKNISPTEVASFLMRKLELGRDRDSILRRLHCRFTCIRIYSSISPALY